MNMPQNAIGILGSGQLGRMLVIAAAQLGIKSHIFAPDANSSPAGEIASTMMIMPRLINLPLALT